MFIIGEDPEAVKLSENYPRYLIVQHQLTDNDKKNPRRSFVYLPTGKESNVDECASRKSLVAT